MDGAEVAGDVEPVAPTRSDHGLHVGVGETPDAGTFFPGFIDDMRIYNAALTAQKIGPLAQ